MWPQGAGLRAALALLLLVEILYLTIAFDTERLDSTPSRWTAAIGSSPQVLRLAIVVGVVAVLLGHRRQRALTPHATRGHAAHGVPDDRNPAWPLLWMAFHLVALWQFTELTSALFAATDAVTTQARSFALAWIGTGSLALAGWGLAFWPATAWWTLLRRHRMLIAWSVVLGLGAWAGGFVTEGLWAPLARATFAVVSVVLGLFYPRVVSQPATLVLGTPAFKVAIAPQCSGYEGMGLIVAFLGIYLWVSRREMRFPGALLLLPLGAAAIWVLNALRIVALIAIGTAGWRSVALGGFHSQAGWITFNAVGLGLVWLVQRRRYFAAAAAPPMTAPDMRAADPTVPLLAPLTVTLAAAILTGAVTSGMDWWYPARVVVALGALWAFRARYAGLGWSLSWQPIAIGAATFLMWLALLPADAARDQWPSALTSLPTHWAAAWLVMRVLGYVVTAPLVEELAFRGYLARRLVGAEVDKVPVGFFTWASFLVSSAIFGAFHGGVWLPATLAGMAFALAMYHRGALGDAVQAHATTNGLIALYVFSTGRWSVWS